MKYPYTITGRLMAFPWKYHWKESRHLRVFTIFTAFAMVPFFWKVQKASKWQIILNNYHNILIDIDH